MILADTCIWVRHWRQPGGDAALATLLRKGEVAVHPFVIGELALGALHPRAQVLGGLRALRAAPEAETEEVFGLIEQYELWGSGLGLVDCHLLASARLGRHELWTFDRPLLRAARRLGVAFS